MEEMLEEPVDKPAWQMFTIVDSRRRCKELIVPALIDGKQVDMELDADALVTFIPKNVWYDVLATKPARKLTSNCEVILVTKFRLSGKLKFKFGIVTRKLYCQ